MDQPTEREWTPYKARRSVALACALRASRTADIRLAPLYLPPASIGLWTFGGPSANAGLAVRRI